MGSSNMKSNTILIELILLQKVILKESVAHKQVYQLKETERVDIYEHLKQGLSINIISKLLGLNRSTISRYLARNSHSIQCLYPRDAQKLTDKNKARHGSRINRNPTLKALVVSQLKEGESVDSIPGFIPVVCFLTSLFFWCEVFRS